jgi:hypothetical protein
MWSSDVDRAALSRGTCSPVRRAVYVKLNRMKVCSRTWALVQSAVLLTTSTGAIYTYMALMAKGYYYKIT